MHGLLGAKPVTLGGTLLVSGELLCPAPLHVLEMQRVRCTQRLKPNTTPDLLQHPTSVLGWFIRWSCLRAAARIYGLILDQAVIKDD